MPATDGTAISYAVENADGTLDDNTAMTILPFRSTDLQMIRNFQNPEEARDDYYDTEDDEVSRDANLSFERVLRPWVYD